MRAKVSWRIVNDDGTYGDIAIAEGDEGELNIRQDNDIVTLPASSIDTFIRCVTHVQGDMNAE